MKILKYSIFSFLMLLAAACSDFGDLNVDKKNPSVVPAESLFGNAEKALVDHITSTNVNTNIGRLLAQYWSETQYTSESRYDFTTRSIPNTHWRTLYRDVLMDLQAARQIVESQSAVTDIAKKEKNNKLASITVLEVYTWQLLVDSFGDIPYSDALKGLDNTNPKYESATTIYKDILNKLNNAITSMDAGAVGFGSADIILKGNTAAWIKFANSLKLRMGMRLADADPSTSKATVEAAAKNVVASNAENVSLKYLGGSPNTNPLWVDLVQSQRNDFVASNTLIDHMNRLSDPRRGLWFNQVGGRFIGNPYGAVGSATYTQYSQINAKLREPSFESIIIDYAEVEFLLAEAVERGYSVGGTAESHYNNGVTASIVYWGGSGADASTYLERNDVKYSSAAGDFKQKIGMQKWLALYNRGFEAWTEWRRLDAPTLNAPEGMDYGDIPKRYIYPNDEPKLNPANYTAAASAIGGDQLTTKLFWDTK